MKEVRNEFIKSMEGRQFELMLVDLADFLTDSRCESVRVINTNKTGNEFDYFIVATMTSNAHLMGVFRELCERLVMMDIDFSNFKNPESGAQWAVIDCYYFAIHLMSPESRSFYDLEGLNKSFSLVRR